MKRRSFLRRIGIASLIPAAAAESVMARQTLKPQPQAIDEHASSRLMSNLIDETTDYTELFNEFEKEVKGKRVDLLGRKITIRKVPSANIYINGVFVTAGGEIEAAESAAVISARYDTGAVDLPYRGGRLGTVTISGRSTFYNRVLIACTNCRSMFARSAVIASTYTWVKSNLGLAAASRQCVVNGPQASVISSEESKSYGFRALNYGAIFSSATVSTGGNIATRHADTSGSYVINLASNTSRIGSGHGAELRVIVSGGEVRDVQIVNAGRGYQIKQCQLEIVDRSGRGRGCRAVMEINKRGEIVSIKILAGGKSYTDNTEALILQHTASSAIIASNTCTLSGCSNAVVISSGRSEVINDFASVLASYKSRARGVRSVVIGSLECKALGEGSIVLGGTKSNAEAKGAVVFGERVISDAPNSLSFGYAGFGRRSSENIKFRVDSKGCIYSAGGLLGAGESRGYAEFFENRESTEIPLGMIVSEREGKVSICNDGEAILGVRSETGLVVGAVGEFHWAKKFLRGEFGELIYHKLKMARIIDSEGRVIYEGAAEEAAGRKLLPGHRLESYLATEPAINPDYDQSKEYIPRGKRAAEWSCIALIGSVNVRVSKAVVQGDYLKAENGIGLKAESVTKLRCIKIVAEFDVVKGYAVAVCLLG